MVVSGLGAKRGGLMEGRGRIDMTEWRFVDCFKGLVDYKQYG